MSRRVSVLLLAAVLASAAGCRNPACGERHGLFTSHTRSEPKCTLVGSGGRMPAEGCYDAVTGQPIPCPPSTTTIPGGTYPPPPAGPGRPDELPFPGPTDLIPRAGVPSAPPSAAPGLGVGAKDGKAVVKQ